MWPFTAIKTKIKSLMTLKLSVGHQHSATYGNYNRMVLEGKSLILGKSVTTMGTTLYQANRRPFV
jgi:hypothetical protein